MLAYIQNDNPLRRHPRRFKAAAWKIVQLIRLRRLWSQCGAVMQAGGRQSYFHTLKCQIRLLFCSRRAQRFGPRQLWGLLGPLVRKVAPIFKHLHSVRGHLQYRSRPQERRFRDYLQRQIRASWTWEPVALARLQRSYQILARPLDSAN